MSETAEDTFEMGTDVGGHQHRGRPTLRRAASATPTTRAHTHPRASETFAKGPGKADKKVPAMKAGGTDEGKGLWGQLKLFAINVFALLLRDGVGALCNKMMSDKAKGYVGATAAQAAVSAGLGTSVAPAVA